MFLKQFGKGGQCEPPPTHKSEHSNNYGNCFKVEFAIRFKAALIHPLWMVHFIRFLQFSINQE